MPQRLVARAEAFLARTAFLLCTLSTPGDGGAQQSLPAPAPRRAVRFCAGGDVTLGTNLDTAWAFRRTGGRVQALPDPATLVEPLRALFADADLVLLNVEGAIGAGAAPRKCAPRSSLCFAFRQPVRAATALRHLTPERARMIGNVANNHAHDAGDDGFATTLRHLTDAGVIVTGADTLATPVGVAEGDTIAVLGFSPWTVARATDLAAVQRHVARAAAQYGRVIVTMHMGAEGPLARHTPNRVERFAGEDRGNSVAFARTAVEAGARLVIGHGPHVLRAMEWAGASGTALVAYSLGNLVTYGPFTHSGPNDRSAVLCATLDALGGVSQAELRSTAQRSPGLVQADSTHAGALEIGQLSREDFPTSGVLVSPTGVVVRRQP